MKPASDRSLHEQQQVEAHFAAATQFWAEAYDRRDTESHRYQERLVRTLRWIDSLEFPRGARALDLGAGAGVAAIELARRGFAVDAVDAVPTMIERIRDQAARAKLDVAAHVADAQELPFASHRYDLVLALGLFPWLQNPSKAMAEVARVARPGGSVIASCANRRAFSVMLEPMYSPSLGPIRHGIVALLRQLHLRSAPPHGPRPNMVRLPAFLRLFSEHGLVVHAWTTYGFAPFSFLNHKLPERLGRRLDTGCQRLADARVPLFRRGGVGYLVLAQLPPHDPGGQQ